MKEEVAEYLLPSLEMHEGSPLCIDATVGIGGHAKYLLDLCPQCTILANDIDGESLSLARKTLSSYVGRVQFLQYWFDDLFLKLSSEQVRAQGILFDFGLSTYHYAQSGRGFSWKTDEALDMRLDPKDERTAADILNTYTQDGLTDLLYRFGEERQAAKWAGRICRARKKQSITTAAQLCSALELGKKPADRNILARVFQSLRIEVNRELERIQSALPRAWNVLAVKGRMAVLSFHSLEDRVVKHFGRIVEGKLKESVLLPKFSTEHEGVGQALCRRPLRADREELEHNKASSSAKLRVFEKIR